MTKGHGFKQEPLGLRKDFHSDPILVFLRLYFRNENHRTSIKSFDWTNVKLKVKISLFELRAQSLQLAYKVKYDFSLSKTLIRLTQEYKINKPPSFQYRVFSLTWPAYMQVYWNKRKWLRKKRIQLPEDWFGTPTWLPFHCFGKPIWPPWRRVKTLYTMRFTF